MITYQITPGTTDVSVVLRIIDSTDGTPETGVVFNTSGIDLEYRREGEASTDITEATLAALTTAHTDGGFLHIGNGLYRLDLPDAACATGSAGCLVHGTVTGMVVIPAYIQLAGAVNKIYSDTTIIYSDTTIATSKAVQIYSDTAIASSKAVQIYSDTTIVYSDTTIATSKATQIYSDTAIASSKAAQIYSDTTIIYSDTAVISSDTTLLEASRGIIDEGTAQAGSTASTFVAQAGLSLANDVPNGSTIQIISGTGAGQSRATTDFVGATDTFTVSPDWTTTPDNTSVYKIFATAPSISVLSVAQDSKLTRVNSKATQIYSDTAVIYSDTTIATSKTTQIYSDTAIASSKAVQIYSDTTIVYSDTTMIQSKSTQIYSDTAITSSKAVQVYSDTTIAVSKATQVYSDTTVIASKAVQVYSDTTAVNSGILYGAAATGTLSTTQATSNLTGYADDQFIGRVIIWLTGACEGEASDITDYANASGLLTFTALTTAPGNTDTFKIV